ncbi:MAG: ABC transporter permease [Candidatus Limiplasma sp.]|nr:ABC transporter permease [Candidatus Limiplasma sp.]
MAERATKRRSEKPIVITWRRLKKNKLATLGLIIILLMIVLALLAPLIIPYKVDAVNLKYKLKLPSAEHWFGTDELGRDIFSRLLYGARFSLQIGIIGVLISATGGILLGSVAGYFGGATDNLIMRLMDVLQAIPGIVLAIAISATLGPGLTNCIIALSISAIPNYARMTRASILNVRKMEYLEAATSINCSNTRIIIKHVLPNAFSPLIVQSTMGIAGTIMGAAMLSFIGLGVQPPTPEWGAMLSAGRNYLRDYPHLCIFPGVTIMIAVLSLNMLGDGLRDALDPKLKD